MPNESPYDVNDPPVGTTNQVTGAADAIFYGWKGVLADAQSQENAKNIIRDAMIEAVTALVVAQVIPSQYDEYLMTFILAQAADKNSVYLNDSTQEAVDELLNRTRLATAETLSTNPVP